MYYVKELKGDDWITLGCSNSQEKCEQIACGYSIEHSGEYQVVNKRNDKFYFVCSYKDGARYE